MLKQYLLFTIDNTLYAVDVFHIQEVLPYKEPQHLPCPDEVIAGLIFSRGKSVSVVDIRKKFDLPEVPIGKDTRTIIMDAINNNHGSMVQFGAIVDSVQEVVTLDDSQLKDPPDFGNSIARKFILSVAEKEGKFILILDVNKIFTFSELNAIEQAQGESESC